MHILVAALVQIFEELVFGVVQTFVEKLILNQLLFVASRAERFPEVDERLQRSKLILELKDLVYRLESHYVKLNVA